MASQGPESIWGNSIDLRQLISMLFRQWHIILGIVALVVVSAIIFTYLIQPTVYEATTGAVVPSSTLGSEFGFSPESYIEIASSTQVLEPIREQLGLQKTVGEFRNQISFKMTNENNLAVSTFAESPEEAFQIADAWSKVYPPQIEILYNQSLDEMNQTASTLKQQLLDKTEELERTKLQDITPFRESHLASLITVLASTGDEVSNDTLVLLKTPQRPGSGSTGGGHSGATSPSWDSPFEIYLDMKTRLSGSRLVALEAELVASENKLRDLSFVLIPKTESELSSLKNLLASEPEFREAKSNSIPMSESQVSSIKQLLASEPEYLGLDLSSGSQIVNPVYLDLQVKLADAELLLATKENSGLESNAGSPIPNPAYLDLQELFSETQLQLSGQRSEEEALPRKIEELEISLDKVRGDLLLLSWENGFAALGKFVDREGHARVPGSHLESGFRLGQWVKSQRSRRDSSSADQVKRLESLPAWTWDILGVSDENLAPDEYYVTKSELISQIKEITEEVITQRHFIRSLEDDINQIRPEYDRVEERITRLIALKGSTNILSQQSSINEPTLPKNPIAPQRGRNIVLATFLGLVLGVGTAILRDYYRSSTPHASYDQA